MSNGIIEYKVYFMVRFMSKDFENKEVMQEKENDKETPEKRNGNRRKKPTARVKKTGRILLRTLVLVVVFCLVIFGGIVISDVFFSDDDGGVTPEIITLTISGDSIILEHNYVTFEDLRTYLKNAEEKGELYTVALINDTSNPADYMVYNKVVDLLGEFGIECEKMEPSATYDEYGVATSDEL